MKRFTLAEYLSVLHLGKRNKNIFFSLYDNGNPKKKKGTPLFKGAKFPFDKEINKIIAQNHNRYITTIDTKNLSSCWDVYETNTYVKIYLSNKYKHYKDKLKIYEIFINNKKCFTSSNQYEIYEWLLNNKELWLNPKDKHKLIGLIHRAQNNEFDNMFIDTIVLDKYDNVIQKED